MAEKKIKAPRFVVAQNELATPGKVYIVHTYEPTFIVEVTPMHGREGEVHFQSLAHDQLSQTELLAIFNRMRDWYRNYRSQVASPGYVSISPASIQLNKEFNEAQKIYDQKNVLSTKGLVDPAVEQFRIVDKLRSLAKQHMSTAEELIQDRDNEEEADRHIAKAEALNDVIKMLLEDGNV
jgi:hypothetical protein